MVVSSGMQSMETMRRVYKTVKEHNQDFAILQCTSAYPLEAQDVNLRVITVSFHKVPVSWSHPGQSGGRFPQREHWSSYSCWKGF